MFVLFADAAVLSAVGDWAQQAGLRRDTGGEPAFWVDDRGLDHRADLGVRGGDEAARARSGGARRGTLLLPVRNGQCSRRAFLRNLRKSDLRTFLKCFAVRFQGLKPLKKESALRRG
jgi:hypothetical protein